MGPLKRDITTLYAVIALAFSTIFIRLSVSDDANLLDFPLAIVWLGIGLRYTVKALREPDE